MKTDDIINQDMMQKPHTYNERPDHEVQMARSELYRAGKSAMALHNMLKRVGEQQGLEGWVQAKITKAADYLESVYHYLDYEMRNPSDDMEMDEAGPIAPGAVPAGSVTTPGNNPMPASTNTGNAQLEKQKATAAVALQKKQIQDQIRATQKQLQDLQKQLQTVGSISQATPMQEMSSAGASSAGGMATAPGGIKNKKKVGSLFGGTYKQGATESSKVLDKHFGTVPGPDVEHDKQKIRALLTQQMGKLPAKYERLLRMRYFQDMTLRQIADKFNLGTERIRQIEAKALRMLKQSNRHPSQRTLGGALDSYSDVHEAANAAQQAAIAISMKKAGKKPKRKEEEMEEGWKSAATGAALLGLGAMGAGGQAQAADMNKAGVTNMKAPVHTTQAVKHEQLKRYPTDPRPDLKLGSIEDMFFNGNTNHDREIRFLNYETDSDAKGMSPQQWSDAQGPKNSPMKTLTPDQQAARKKIPLRTANWHPDDDNMPQSKFESKDKTGPKFTGYWKGKNKGKPGKKMVGDA